MSANGTSWAPVTWPAHVPGRSRQAVRLDDPGRRSAVPDTELSPPDSRNSTVQRPARSGTGGAARGASRHPWPTTIISAAAATAARFGHRYHPELCTCSCLSSDSLLPAGTGFRPVVCTVVDVLGAPQPGRLVRREWGSGPSAVAEQLMRDQPTQAVVPAHERAGQPAAPVGGAPTHPLAIAVLIVVVVEDIRGPRVGIEPGTMPSPAAYRVGGRSSPPCDGPGVLRRDHAREHSMH